MERTGLMVPLLLISVLLPLGTRSCTTSMSPIRLVCIKVKQDGSDSSDTHLGTFWYHSHLSTQYCDGLRGAFVVYDPNDPNAHLYDVDDGTRTRSLTSDYEIAHSSIQKVL